MKVVLGSQGKGAWNKKRSLLLRMLESLIIRWIMRVKQKILSLSFLIPYMSSRMKEKDKN